MDQVVSFLAIASGYIIAFAVGAWIGRPLLGLLTDRIFKK
jgi:membrane protein DedA with SNARE-associated domain